MKPIHQVKLGVFGEGDCAWACLASLFEEPLESFAYDKLVAPSDADLAKLTDCRWPHLRCHSLDLAEGTYRLVPGPSVYGHEWPERWAFDFATAWEPPTYDYWIGTVPSQKLQRPEHDPYFGMPALHAVIMLGDNVAHDPNPQNDPYPPHPPLAAQTWWEPR